MEDKVLNIDTQLLAEIKSLLGNALNVSAIDLSKYDTDAVKSLFMKGYLYRVSKNIVISEDQKNYLIKIIGDLPENFSVTEFKEKTSLSRKYAIPFLEFLDKEFITRKIDSSGLREKIN
jgi:6-phosphogluconate dehydrogenase